MFTRPATVEVRTTRLHASHFSPVHAYAHAAYLYSDYEQQEPTEPNYIHEIVALLQCIL